MRLGQWRELTKDLPDDTDLVVDTEDEFRWAEVVIRATLPPKPGRPPVVMLEPGQVWNEELDLDARFDDHIGYDPNEQDDQH